MDSSTSTQQTTPSWGDFDPVHLVLGDYQFSLCLLTLQQLVSIVFGLVGRIKHGLKYMSGFEPISHLHCGENATHKWGTTQGFKPQFRTPNISERTRVVEVVNIGTTSGPSSHGPASVQSIDLLLTDKGELLMWKHSHASYGTTGNGSRVITDSMFEQMDKDSLTASISLFIWQAALYGVIVKLRDLSEANLAQKQKNYELAQGMRKTIEHVYDMLKP